MSTITNAKRADWACRSLQVFRQVTGTHDEDPDTVIRDFLCNLRHYCDEMAVDFDLAWKESANTYHQEIADEINAQPTDKNQLSTERLVPHTPGPWLDCGLGSVTHPITGEDMTLNVVEADGFGRIGEWLDYSNEPDGNFRLICAAPQLFAALDHLLAEPHHPAARDAALTALTEVGAPRQHG